MTLTLIPNAFVEKFTTTDGGDMKKKEMRKNSSQDMVNVGYGESETTALHQRTDCLRAFALTAGDSADGAGRPAATVLPRGTPRALWALGDNAAGSTQQQQT